MTIINLIKSEHHTPFCKRIKVLREFKGYVHENTAVVDHHGKTLAYGINTLIEGADEDIITWLKENEPVWIGT